ncbi:MAG: DEAD/DEAH box helicase, partial [Candidatus Nealsonbacteria bacterium]|nr:DEAD/DEAH box helicase [Candidatus Nealsonbacteria bacterium]
MKFEKLGLAKPILRAVEAEGYEIATPIQVKAIPEVIKGCDLVGCAQTGTGKTAAFALPTLQRLCARGN